MVRFLEHCIASSSAPPPLPPPNDSNESKNNSTPIPAPPFFPSRVHHNVFKGVLHLVELRYWLETTAALHWLLAASHAMMVTRTEGGVARIGAYDRGGAKRRTITGNRVDPPWFEFKAITISLAAAVCACWLAGFFSFCFVVSRASPRLYFFFFLLVISWRMERRAFRLLFPTWLREEVCDVQYGTLSSRYAYCKYMSWRVDNKLVPTDVGGSHHRLKYTYIRICAAIS
jgi:hypothetical protein